MGAPTEVRDARAAGSVSTVSAGDRGARLVSGSAIPRGLDVSSWRETRGEATALLQSLLRINTSNPPGDEIAAAELLAASLRAEGLEPEILLSAPGRANLVCRIPAREGRGRSASEPASAAPLLLATHLDVVPPGDPARWRHPPFSGDLAEGMIWGRGAVDMKNMVAMSAMVVKLLARRGAPLRRDLIFAAVADEEAGCELGSRFLVERHPEKVRAGFAIGEVGGFPLKVGRARFLLVQTAEKGSCWLRATARGPAGHGSMPRTDSAVLALARAICLLGERSLPQHNTAVVESFIRQVAARQPLPLRQIMPRLLNPRLSPLILDRLMADQGQARTFRAILHNTVAPTVLRAGEATNVIPESASVELDGRLLPGQRGEDLLRELRELLGDSLELEVLREHPGVVNHPPDSELWDCIRSAVGERDPGLEVVPYMIPGFTDAQSFCRLGARWYGFSPLLLDPASGLRFSDLFHGIDERIPEEGFHWGLSVLHDVVARFCLAGERA
jgi:acetylornithine deacetylase/succinyl-diaminopimelate desuccinylase-like protein